MGIRGRQVVRSECVCVCFRYLCVRAFVCARVRGLRVLRSGSARVLTCEAGRACALQDGPHWFGGYSDIRDPPKEGADSISGKGLPGVNVYSWSADKVLAARDTQQVQKIDRQDSSSLWQDVDKIGQGIAAFLWPPIQKEPPTQVCCSYRCCQYSV